MIALTIDFVILIFLGGFAPIMFYYATISAILIAKKNNSEQNGSGSQKVTFKEKLIVALLCALFSYVLFKMNVDSANKAIGEIFSPFKSLYCHVMECVDKPSVAENGGDNGGYSVTDDESAWNKAINENTQHSYQLYIDNMTHGTHRKEAEVRRNEIFAREKNITDNISLLETEARLYRQLT